MIRSPDPGELRQVLTYQEIVETTDRTGAPVETPTAVVTLRAKVEPLDGRETFQARQAQSSATHEVTVRFDARISAKGRFVFRDQPGRVLDVESARNLEERNIWLVCRCIEES
jgi:SPP1 family predicted phage head-tail adaptor